MQRAQVPPALCLGIALSLSMGAGAVEPDHPEVLVVVNGASEISQAIGRYYAFRRGVPLRNLIELDLPLLDATLTTGRHEDVSRDDFEQRIRDPIARYLEAQGLIDTIQYIVTTKGIPLRIWSDGPDAPYAARTSASVDAELALLFSGLDGSPGTGSLVNRYFAQDVPFERWRRDHPLAPLRYLVARLTGYQTEVNEETGVPGDVKHLIDAAFASEPARLYVIDEDPSQKGARSGGNAVLLAPAAAALGALGVRVIHDRRKAVAANQTGIAGYASWGSNDRQSLSKPYYGEVDGRHVPGTFAGRALAVDLVSFNARSFSYPTRYGQSLVADLVRLGAAGAAGHVFEPTLAAVARPYLLLAAFASGVPAGEAYFRSIPYLGWTNVFVGDPLMRVTDPAPPSPDRDADGVPDPIDNCLWMPNPDQRDTNDDGYGNLCDPDLNGDGRVDGFDPLGALTDLDRLQRSIVTNLYVPDHDLDGDGKVDERDLGIAQLYLHLPPGPSGRWGAAPPTARPHQAATPRRR